jgi:hypothetical protein
MALRVLLLTGLLAAAVPARAEPVAAPPAPTTEATAPAKEDKGDAAARAATEAAAAQRATQDLEAQMIQLRRAQEALERERAAYDDVRRRLDELDARLAEAERRQAADTTGAMVPGEGGGGLRFRDDGFVIRSPDGRFMIRPRLWLQALYDGEIASQGSADPAAPEVSSFSVAHAQTILEGHVGTPAFEYRLQLDFARPAPTGHVVLDAFVQWRIFRSLAVRAGNFKVPDGLQRNLWRAELQFADVSAPMAAFSLERDTGLEVIGKPFAGRLQYEVAVLNGSGMLSGNDNRAFAYTARVVAAPFGPLPGGEGDLEHHEKPLLSVGVSGYYNLLPTDIRARYNDPNANVDMNNDGRVDNVAIWQGGVEVRAVWRGFAVQGEGFGRIEDPGVAGSARHFWGAYVQASGFIIPQRLELAGRVGRTDLPMYGATADARARAGNGVDEEAGALNAYLRGRLIKIAVDYTHQTARDATSAPEMHRVRALAQLGF